METMRKNIEELLRWMTGGKYGLDNFIFFKIKGDSKSAFEKITSSTLQETKPVIVASEQEAKPVVAASEQEMKPVVVASSVLIRKRQRNDREAFIPKTRIIDRISQICIVCLGICLICLILFGVIYLIILWVMK